MKKLYVLFVVISICFTGFSQCDNPPSPPVIACYDRNPFESTFKLSIENEVSTKLEVQILNSTGLLISTRYVPIDDLGETQFGEDLTPGVYFVLVKQGNNRQTLRMIKY